DINHALGFSQIVDGDDIGMREPGTGAGLAIETLFELRIELRIGPQHLQSNCPVEHLIPGPIDGSHRSSSDLVDYLIFPDGPHLESVLANPPASMNCNSAAPPR